MSKRVEKPETPVEEIEAAEERGRKREKGKEPRKGA